MTADSTERPLPERLPAQAAASSKGTRRKGRELALQALYQIEMTGDPSSAAVDFFLRHFEGTAATKEFARRLVSGAVGQRGAIDRVIERHTENWKIERLSKVDLIILRMATYEILYCPDIPAPVSVDEAIEIGKRYGGADSGRFINGILDQVLKSAAAAE